MQFKDVIGQKELKQHLINEVKSDRISHAQLFLGKAGYGSLPLALAFIQYIFCDNKTNFDSCGKCSNCNKITKLQHPDLHFTFPVVQAISKKSDFFYEEWRAQIIENPYFELKNWIQKIDEKGRSAIISSDESQNVIEKLSLKSFQGKEKICLIWMAEKMNPSCANKMLKIIEEPPKNTLFVLISENIEMMLPTIISRTQILNLKSLTKEDIAINIQSKYGLNELDSLRFASLSKNNYINTLNLLDNNEELSNFYEMFVKWMRFCYGKDVLGMIQWSEDISIKGKNYQTSFLNYSLHVFRQSIHRNYLGENYLEVSEEEFLFLSKFGKFITNKNILNLNVKISNAQVYIEKNANSKILFTNLSFELMKLLRNS